MTNNCLSLLVIVVDHSCKQEWLALVLCVVQSACHVINGPGEKWSRD